MNEIYAVVWRSAYEELEYHSFLRDKDVAECVAYWLNVLHDQYEDQRVEVWTIKLY